MRDGAKDMDRKIKTTKQQIKIVEKAFCNLISQ